MASAKTTPRIPNEFNDVFIANWCFKDPSVLSDIKGERCHKAVPGAPKTSSICSIVPLGVDQMAKWYSSTVCGSTKM